jgi:hypothetical protein
MIKKRPIVMDGVPISCELDRQHRPRAASWRRLISPEPDDAALTILP